MNDNHIICVDVDTTGPDPLKHEVVGIYAVCVDPRSLMVPTDGVFETTIRPSRPEDADEAVVRASGIKLADLAESPLPSVAWLSFARWIVGWGKPGNTAPILAGRNLEQVLAFITANNSHFKGKFLFYRPTMLSLEALLFTWFENASDLPGLGLDQVRAYLGIEARKSGKIPRIRRDVEDTMLIISHFLRLHRKLAETECVVFKETLKGI